MADASLIAAYGTVVNVAGDVRIDSKYCRQGFNVEARKMGGHGAYLLDFDTDPPSPGPALPRPPVVLATARGTTDSDDHPCYAQTRRVSRDEAVIHIFQTPSNAFYVQPGLIEAISIFSSSKRSARSSNKNERATQLLLRNSASTRPAACISASR